MESDRMEMALHTNESKQCVVYNCIKDDNDLEFQRKLASMSPCNRNGSIRITLNIFFPLYVFSLVFNEQSSQNGLNNTKNISLDVVPLRTDKEKKRKIEKLIIM